MSNDPQVHAADSAEDEGQVSLPQITPPAKVLTSQPAKVPTYPMSSMHISPAGLAFITSVEGRGSDTDGLQSPGGWSGVTVGLGYDLYGRNPNEIVSDLTSIGIPRAKAEFLSSQTN